MKHLLLVLACASSLAIHAQDPAGSCLFIDYDAFQADGVLRYIDCGNADAFNTGAELTIQCWSRINDTNWNQKICGKTNGNFNSGYVFAIDQGDVYGEVWNPGLNEIHDGFIPPVQLWYHMAITFKAGETMKGYVNGELVQEENVSGADIAANVESFIIGIAPWDLANFQTFGELDELTVHNIALTEEALKENMFKQAGGMGLVAHYNFNGGGAALTDASGNGNDGTLYGLTDGDWAPSRAPIGDATMTSQTNVVGLWNGVTFADPRFVITENGLSLSASGMDDLDYAVFGHNNGTGVQSDNLPGDAPANFMATGRAWYLNELGSIDATMTFNLDQAAPGGGALDNTQPANHYTLMYRANAADTWSLIAQANIFTDPAVVFEDVPLATGWYAVGVGDAPASVSVNEQPSHQIPVSFFPNPVHDQLTIDLSELQDGNVLVRITDTTGKLVQHHMLSPRETHRVDVSALQSGNYIVHIETALGIQRGGLVVR